MERSAQRVLLILDDTPEVARALRRFMSNDFDVVREASTPEEAERFLGDPESPTTHLICDHYLGKGVPLGADLIRRWRRSYPLLQVAVLHTGSDMEGLVAGDGIDKVFGKPLDARELLQFLLAAGDCAAAT
jgi:CheY-like chemotaxis protein